MELLMRAVLGVKHNKTLQPHRWKIFDRIFDNISLWSRCVACSLEASSDLQPPLSLLATNIYVAHIHILVLVPPFPSWVLGTVSEINSAGSILQHSLEKSSEDWGGGDKNRMAVSPMEAQSDSYVGLIYSVACRANVRTRKRSSG